MTIMTGAEMVVRALRDHSMPGAMAISGDTEHVMVAGVRKQFSDEVTEELLG